MSKIAIACLLMIGTNGICQSSGLESGSTVHLASGSDVAAAVRNSPGGTVFVLASGVYRLQSITPKDNDVFRGEGDAVLNGSKLLLMQQEGQLWFANEMPTRAEPTYCENNHPNCWITNDLFIDDQLQIPVENRSELGPGKCFHDLTSGKVYISSNPTGHKVELSTSIAAFSGTASGIQILNLIVEKYANPIQSGAIGGGHARARKWTVQNVEVRWNHGIGISLGPGAHIESCKVHHNGQMGLGASGADVLILKNEIAYNNYAGYEADWEAGGTKFSGTENLAVQSNYVHDNMGNGLWTDIDNIHSLYENNRVINNEGEGLRHEISYDAIIRNNVFKGNKAGIVVVLSPNVEVYGNVIEVPSDGTDGIRLANGQRGVGAYGPHITHDDHVHNNIVVYLGPVAHSGLSGPLQSATGVTFDFNEYHITGGGNSHWIWGASLSTIFAMHKLGFEQHSTMSTAPPKVPDLGH